MNKRTIISTLIILPLISSCRGAPIQYERAKEIKDSIKAKLADSTFVPEVKLFTKKEYRISDATTTVIQEIYNREKMFCSYYEIVDNKSVKEEFYYRQDDAEKGIYLISAVRMNGEWDKDKIIKTHYKTEAEVKETWDKYHKETILTKIVSESNQCINKMEDIFGYADGEEISVSVSCMSENNESLSVEARYNQSSMVSAQEVTNRYEYKLYIKDYIIASYEYNLDSAHNSSLGYNYNKAIINLPKLPI